MLYKVEITYTKNFERGGTGPPGSAPELYNVKKLHGHASLHYTTSHIHTHTHTRVLLFTCKPQEEVSCDGLATCKWEQALLKLKMTNDIPWMPVLPYSGS